MEVSSEAGIELQEELSALKQNLKELELYKKEYRHTIEKLRRSETILRMLCDSTGDAVMLMDDNGFLDCNKAALSLYGYITKEDFCSINPIDLFSHGQPCGADPVALCKHHFAMAFKNGKHRYEWMQKRVDNGEVFPSEVSLTATSLYNKPILQVAIRDINERIHMEEVLRRERDLSTVMVESSPAFFVAIDFDGKVRLMNDSMLHALGYTLEEVVGRDYIYTFVPDGDREKLSKVFSKLLTQTEPTVNENKLLTKDGWELLVEWHGHSISKPDGSLDYFIGVGINVTERNHMEELLRESEARLRSIAGSAQDAIVMMDPGGAISYWNPKSEEVFGYYRDEVIGKNLHDLLAPKRYLELYESALSGFARTGEGNFVGKTIELSAIRKDGEEISVDLSLSVVWLNGKPFAVGIARDASERKKAEEEKRHSEKLSASLEMAGAICHEMNQPLQVIIGHVDLLSITNNDERVLQSLKIMNEQISKIGIITKKLMGLKKYSSREYLDDIKITDIY